MATRYIYLNDQLNEKLKKEINVSALISRLLISYYKNSEKINLEDLNKKIGEIEQKKVDLLNSLENEEENIKTKIEIKNKEIQHEETQKKLNEEKEKLKRENIKKTFIENTGIEMPEDLLNEYIEQDKNIYSFMKDRGLIEKEEVCEED